MCITLRVSGGKGNREEGVMLKFYGYRRANDQVGVRNHIIILPTSVCSSETAKKIAETVEGTVALPNQHGCCQVGIDHEQTLRTLIGLGKNPNVAACLVVGLGCEGIQASIVAESIAKLGKPVEVINIQQCRGTLKTVEIGNQIAKKMLDKVSMQSREKFNLSELVLGLECGGSDATSGIAANPVVGHTSDLLVAVGGTVIISEITELIGAEHILARRTVSPVIKDKLLCAVHRCEERAISLGVNIRSGQPTPGNIQGGITTIEEKSLGCIYKAGTAFIQDILEYGESAKGKGLYIMDTPGQDVESVTGMLAGGAQIILFTTGRGTPTGSPIAPVIKLTGNANTFEIMKDNIDISVAGIISGEISLNEAGEETLREVIRVASGKQTKSEILGHREMGIHKIAPTF